MRQKILTANWKMNQTRATINNFFNTFEKECPSALTNTQIRFAVPYTLIETAHSRCKNTPFQIGAQNVHQKTKGAYTGEISIEMLQEIGASFTLLGHSERRQYQNETNEVIASKVQACQKSNFGIIACVGETLKQREEGKTSAIILDQLEAILKEWVNNNNQLIIAYEPVWAIGTGLSASPKQAQEVHQTIRSVISSTLGSAIAQSTPILYGGSMNPDNIRPLLEQADIDGGLVGGASLDPSKFADMLKQIV